MKYLTKEFYNAMQKMSLRYPLRASKKAEVFSEDYFKKLYKKEEDKRIKKRKAAYEVKFEDMFPEELTEELAYFFNLVELAPEEAQKAYLEQREQLKYNFDSRPKLSVEQEIKRFKQAFRNRLNYLNKLLPEHILQKVADIRVLAMNVAAPEVKKEITAYCKQNKKFVFSTLDAYKKQLNKQFGPNAPFEEELNLHDNVVLSCRKRGKDIVLTIDNSYGYSTFSTIVFKNCTVIKQDAPLHGAWFLYNEIYKSGDKFELHFLLEKHNKLIDYTILTDGVNAF